MTAPIQCEIGQYQPSSKQSDCIDCPAGSYCPYPDSNVTGPTEVKICEAGNYCSGSVTKMTQCGLGEYQPYTGNTSCIKCAPGTYQSNMGSTSCIVSSAGSMCPYTGMSAQIPCPVGYFCLQGTSVTNSSVCDSSFNQSSTQPKPCEIHYYCPEGSSNQTICENGKFSNETCSQSCYDCNDGFLCKGDGQQTLCPAGYYCTNNQQYSCPHGYYCLLGTTTGDINSNVTTRPLPCSPGTYCSNKNTSPNPDSKTSGSAVYCSEGTYNDKYAASACTTCPQGYQCPNTGMTKPMICPQGTYRTNDSLILLCQSCLEGSYNNKTGSYNSDDCIICDAGVVCIGMGMSYPNTNNSRNCSEGYYCVAGTGLGTRNLNSCPAGTYCFSGTKSLLEAQANECPAGRYCAAGTGATYEQATSCSNSSDCTIGTSCASKYYCPKGTTVMINCPA